MSDDLAAIVARQKPRAENNSLPTDLMVSRVDLAALCAAVERLTAQRDTARQGLCEQSDAKMTAMDERDAARAEIAQLEGHKADWRRMCEEAQRVAKEAIDQMATARQVARQVAAHCEACGGVGRVVRDGIGPSEASIVSERCPKCGPIRAANPWLTSLQPRPTAPV